MWRHFRCCTKQGGTTGRGDLHAAFCILKASYDLINSSMTDYGTFKISTGPICLASPAFASLRSLLALLSVANSPAPWLIPTP
jgi:hypothetical protein